MPSNRFPGVEALEAFLRHHLAATPLADLSPFEYALQYLELPLDEDHDIEETYELFWGVCCLEDEFHAFQNKKQNRRSEKKQASIAAAVPLPEETDPEPYYAHREIAPSHHKHRPESVKPIAPAVPAVQAQTAAATFDSFAHDAKLDAIRARTRQLEAENIELEKDIALLTARLRFSTLESSHAETSAGMFSALSGSSSASSAGSAFDSVEAKLDTYKATIRGKIEERYHTVDGIAAKADAFQNTIRARLAKL